jgi:hypothetical protein
MTGDGTHSSHGMPWGDMTWGTWDITWGWLVGISWQGLPCNSFTHGMRSKSADVCGRVARTAPWGNGPWSVLRNIRSKTLDATWEFITKKTDHNLD